MIFMSIEMRQVEIHQYCIICLLFVQVLAKYKDMSKDQIELITTLFFTRAKTVAKLLEDLKKKGKGSEEIIGE